MKFLPVISETVAMKTRMSASFRFSVWSPGWASADDANAMAARSETKLRNPVTRTPPVRHSRGRGNRLLSIVAGRTRAARRYPVGKRPATWSSQAHREFLGLAPAAHGHADRARVLEARGDRLGAREAVERDAVDLRHDVVGLQPELRERGGFAPARQAHADELAVLDHRQHL